MKNHSFVVAGMAFALVACAKPPAVSPAKPVATPKTVAPSPASPLLFSFSADELRELRNRLSRSIVIVAYDGKTIEVLPQCTAEGEYSLMAMNEKQTKLKLETPDEVALNVPLTSKKKTSESGISLNLMLTGRWTSTRAVVERKVLQGECARATHFIHHLDTGVSAPINKTIAACPDDYDGEHACAAPFRAHLHPFGESPSWDTVRMMPPLYCPDKTFVAEQKCAPVKPFEPYACRMSDPRECETQCTIGNMSSCNTLGWMIARASDDAREITSALKMLERACDGGEMRACGNLAVATIGNQVPITTGEVAKLYGKSCLQGDEESCLWLGDLMAETPELASNAQSFFMQACFGGSTEACGRRAMTMENEGDGAVEFARELHRRACNEGYQPSCVRLGVMMVHAFGGPMDAVTGKQLLESACAGDNAEACANLGFVYQNASGAGQNYVKAGEYYDKACNSNSAYGCRMLALMYENALGRTRDMSRAAGLYAKGCTIGEPDSCLELGRLHTTGEGILKDERRAVELFEGACQKNVVVGCHNLAILLADGKGAPQDAKRARELHEKACKAGYSRSCRMLAPAKP